MKFSVKLLVVLLFSALTFHAQAKTHTKKHAKELTAMCTGVEEKMNSSAHDLTYCANDELKKVFDLNKDTVTMTNEVLEKCSYFLDQSAQLSYTSSICNKAYSTGHSYTRVTELTDFTVDKARLDIENAMRELLDAKIEETKESGK